MTELTLIMIELTLLLAHWVILQKVEERWQRCDGVSSSGADVFARECTLSMLPAAVGYCSSVEPTVELEHRQRCVPKPSKRL
jgi:hypothetical protein